MTDFRLSDSFVEKYVRKHPKWGQIGEITYKSKYARPVEGENRTEEWWETIKRVVEGCYTIQKEHCEKLRLPWNHNKAAKSAQEMYRLMWEMKFLPPGRGLWSMGTKYIKERGAAPLYNCGYTSTREINVDFAEPFCFLMDLSMLGVGIGGDTKGAGTVKIKQPREGDYIFTVEDSREGWVELVRTILNTFVWRGSLPKEIDYSKVRLYGEPIRTLGGTSSGPGPLKQLSQDIQDILGPLIDKTITSEAIADLFNAISRCVVSGNLRRSACLILGAPNDQDFLNLKDSNKSERHAFLNSDEGWRWSSNNSIFATVGMDYGPFVRGITQRGEPGFFWLSTAQQFDRLSDPPHEADPKITGCNPCSEISMEDKELCNVPETFPSRHETLEEYKRTLKFAYLYGKTVTLIPTHNERTNAVQLRNRKIGLSMSGIVQNIQRIGIRKHFQWCNEAYAYLRGLDKIYSDWLCIPRSTKITAVKPAGTTSLLPGATPGVHFPIAEYYWRCQRHAGGSPFVKALRDAGYRIEEGEGHNTVVVYFPVKEENYWKCRSDVTIWEQLEIAAQMQAYWSDNQVSVTITFKPEEADQIELALQFYEDKLKAVSFLPLLTIEEMKKKGFKHPPYQVLTKEEYEQAIAELKPVKLRKIAETRGFEKVFCDSESCMTTEG